MGFQIISRQLKFQSNLRQVKCTRMSILFTNHSFMVLFSCGPDHSFMVLFSCGPPEHHPRTSISAKLIQNVMLLHVYILESIGNPRKSCTGYQKFNLIYLNHCQTKGLQIQRVTNTILPSVHGKHVHRNPRKVQCTIQLN